MILRLAVVVLGIFYFVIRFLFVDKSTPRYFVVDYFEAIDFISSYVYYPEEYFRKEILPYFSAVSIRLKSLNELKNEGLVDLATSESVKVEPKFWLLPLGNMILETGYSFIYSSSQEKLKKVEEVIKYLGLEYKRIGNVLAVKASGSYLFNIQVFYLDDFQTEKKILWKVSSYVYDLEYLKVYCKKGDFVVFTGPFVAGYPDKLDKVKNFLKENGLIFATPEFYDSKNIQFGAVELVQHGGIKIFSTIVLRNKPLNQILNSVDLAVNERNCKAVMFRFFDKYSLQQNMNIIKQIENKFFRYINPLEFETEINPNIRFLIDFLSVINLILIGILVIVSYSYYYDLVSNNGYPVSGSIFAILGIGNSLGIILGKVFKVDTIFSLSLVVGVSFILVTMFFKVFEYRKNMYVRYMEIIIYTLSIGLVINSLFFENTYILGIEKVRFVKLLLILPVVLSCFVVFSYSQVVLFFYRRMRILDFSLIFIVLVGVVFYLLRSGNTDLLLPFEDKVRNILDKFLIARPRFKEFLIGDPAILASSYSKYFIPLSFLGLSSIVNSFMHIHTPIFYSFLRTFWGAVLGIVIFLLIVKIMKVNLERRSKIEKGGMVKE